MIILDTRLKTPLYLQIYEQMKNRVISGRIPYNSRLPSIRALSETLGVSKNTVTYAYRQLCAEGYVTNRERSGFYAQKLEYPQDRGITGDPKEDGAGSSGQADSPGFSGCRYDFHYGSINPLDFPLNTWRKLSNKIISPAHLNKMVSYPDSSGEPELRTAILRYLNISRGVNCRPGQVVLCSGTQQCLNLVCRLLKPDSTAPASVAMEDPGYDGARVVFENNSLNIIPVPVEKGGIRIRDLENSPARLVYITPSRQFPTGEIMPIRRRLKLLEWAARTKAVIIEDDYDSEFRYTGNPIPAIQSIDTKGQVIYMGTFSRSLSPALRMSYMVIPTPLLASFRQIFQRYNTVVPWMEQKLVETFIKEGHWEKHLRRIRLANKKRHDTLIASIHSTMADKVRIIGKNAGLHILLEIDNGFSEEELISSVRRKGVAVGPVSRYWIDRERCKIPMVLIGYSGMDSAEIEAGVMRLKKAWF
ncbi:MAG: PLP-dependent aminotransferase family protein [Desulfobacterales bacterium]|nr:PLP-dependent aminotransferase family protein [Desulfobacterales bacterium]